MRPNRKVAFCGYAMVNRAGASHADSSPQDGPAVKTAAARIYVARYYPGYRRQTICILALATARRIGVSVTVN